MRAEIYARRDSPVHALHPATKLVLLVVVLAAPFLSQDLGAQALALVLAVAAASAGRVVREALGPWKLIAFIFAITFAIWALAGKGDALPTWASIRANSTAALAYSLRVTAIFIFGLVFLATTRIEETIHALEMFRVPYRLAFALGLAFRLVPLFLGAAASIAEAQRARGLDLERGGLVERLRKYVPILVPVFMTALRDADQMAMALEARGFAAGVRRTRMRRYDLGPGDLVALDLAALVLLAFVKMKSGGLSLVPQ